jgi:serine/threonine protein kinase
MSTKAKSSKPKVVLASKLIVGITKPVTDDYTLGKKLGEKGQFGYAQLATHKVTGVQRAIKVINKGRFNPRHYEQFRAEVAFLKSLNHKYIGTSSCMSL